MASGIMVASTVGAIDTILDALNAPSSLSQRRHSICNFELPPPSSLQFDKLMPAQKFPPLAGLNTPSLASVGQLLTPPLSSSTAASSRSGPSSTQASIPVLPYTPAFSGTSTTPVGYPQVSWTPSWQNGPLMPARSMFAPLRQMRHSGEASNSSAPSYDLQSLPEEGDEDVHSSVRYLDARYEDPDQLPGSPAERSSPKSVSKDNLSISIPFMRPPPPSCSLPAMPGPIMSDVHRRDAQMENVSNYGRPVMYDLQRGQAFTGNASERAFKCDQCPQSFNRNHDLKRHKRIHLAVKPFPCNHCNKSFSRKDALKRHILVKGCGSPSTTTLEKNDSSDSISTSHFLSMWYKACSNLRQTTTQHQDLEDRPDVQLARCTRDDQYPPKSVEAPAPPIACQSTPIHLVRMTVVDNGEQSSLGQKEGTNIEDWLAESTAPDTIGRSASLASPASAFTATTPSQRSSSLVASTPKTSDSPYFDSDGERSFVQSEDSLSITWSVSSAAAVISLAERLASDYLAKTDAPSDGPDGSAQTKPTSNSSGRTNASESSTRASSSGSASSAASKRPYRNEEEEGSQRRKRPKLPNQAIGGPDTKLLACPYMKFDPQRYSERNPTEKNYRGCSSCFLKDMNRLKQHLYRVHRRPEHYCSFCFCLFDSGSALDDHIVERSCERQLPPFDEKMTSDQFKAIKRREMGKSTKDAWFDIYKILFPASPLPLDPYAESVHANTVQDFVAFFEREAPRVLASEINVRLFGAATVTPEHEQFVDSVLTESISVLLQRLNERFGRRGLPSLGLVELPVLVG